jgi:hypothetical protein
MTLILSFVAYVIAAGCFVIQWGEWADNAEHLIDAGLFFTAVGLAFQALPAVLNRRAP